MEYSFLFSKIQNYKKSTKKQKLIVENKAAVFYCEALYSDIIGATCSTVKYKNNKHMSRFERNAYIATGALNTAVN